MRELDYMVSWLLLLFGKGSIVTSLDDTDPGIRLYGILAATAVWKRVYHHFIGCFPFWEA